MSSILPFIPQLMNGLVVTIKVAGASFVLGLAIAMGFTFFLRFGPRFIQRLIAIYVSVIRGIPELLIIFLVFYGGRAILTIIAETYATSPSDEAGNGTAFLSKLIDLYIEADAFSAGVFALAAISSAYFTEILRGALQTIPAGQQEAATSLGLDEKKTFRHILLPQMFAYALPGLGNQWLLILKDSALVSIIGLEELMRKGIVAGGATHASMTFYLIVAVFYITITSVSSVLFALGNRYLNAKR